MGALWLLSQRAAAQSETDALFALFTGFSLAVLALGLGLILAMVLVLRWLFRGIRARRERAAQRARERAAEREARLRAHREAVAELLQHFERDPEAVLGDYMGQIRASLDLDAIYRPKRAEEVVAVFPSELVQVEGETKAYPYGGLATSLALWGSADGPPEGVSVPQLWRSSVSSKGDGILVVTNKRLYFNLTGPGKDWSRTWATITTWGVYSNAVRVEVTNGRPLVFFLNSDDPLTHPGFVAAVLEHAHDQGASPKER